MKSQCNSQTGWQTTLLMLLALSCLGPISVSCRSLQQDPPTDVATLTSATAAPESPTPETTRKGEPISITPEDAAAAAAAAAADLATAAAAAEPQQSVPAQYAQILSEHNRYRALHGVPPMAWSTALGTSSANWASQCTFKHSGAGENLYATSQTGAGAAAAALAGAIKGWYDEISMYDFSKPDFSMDTGHFTQVVWRGSTQLGCAAQSCGMIQGFMAGTIVVCHYRPAGNVLGQFADNVPPLLPGGGGSNPPPNSPSPAPGQSPAPDQNFPPFNPKSILASGSRLAAGRCKMSPNARYRMCVSAATGELLVQVKTAQNTWGSSWSNSVRATSSSATKPYRLELRQDGNLVAMGANRVRYWETKTTGTGPYILVVRDTGNLSLFDSRGRCLWSARGNCLVRRGSGLQVQP